MIKKVYSPDGAACISTYSQVAMHNGFAFISGQMSSDPASGGLIHCSVKEQTERALYGMKTLLAGINAQMSDVVMVCVHLSSMDVYDEMNQAYEKYFAVDQPARVCVAATELYDQLDVEFTSVVALNQKE